jgi:hypothetical protein
LTTEILLILHELMDRIVLLRIVSEHSLS